MCEESTEDGTRLAPQLLSRLRCKTGVVPCSSTRVLGHPTTRLLVKRVIVRFVNALAVVAYKGVTL